VDDPIVFVPKYQSGNYITGPQLPNQGTVQKKVWQTWDALNGGWWTGPTTDPDNGGALYKLSAYISQHPLARILNTSSTIGGIRLNAGGPGFANNFMGNADAFIIGVYGNSKIFDFELGIDAGQDRSVVYGYGSNCTTLAGNVYTGVTPFQYSWSNDLMVLSDTKNVTVCPTDTTTYTLTVTDATGCIRTDQVTMFVNDVRCGNKMDKVMVCHNGQTICISPNAVKAHLNHGDYLGNCSNSTQAARVNPQPSITTKETVPSDRSQLNEFKISNYPNPFVNVTTIQYELPVDCVVSIRVYDQAGRLVSTPVSGNKKAGLYSFSFNGNNLSEGLYSYRMAATGGIKTFTKTNKIIIVH
ncbi:MAG: FlgD immunoglobulin-like domain containing protein, partial [Ginsengibacter sp.]